MSLFEETYLKPSTIAARLDVHRSHVYKLIKDGRSRIFALARRCGCPCQR